MIQDLLQPVREGLYEQVDRHMAFFQLRVGEEAQGSGTDRQPNEILITGKSRHIDTERFQGEIQRERPDVHGGDEYDDDREQSPQECPQRHDPLQQSVHFLALLKKRTALTAPFAILLVFLDP